MASLPESSTFDAGVYQLELTDPVIGGPSGVSNAPLKNLANRTKYLKDHVDALESSRAPLASPEFTGTPKVPTAAAGTNTTQAASTAFVKAAVDSAVPDLSGYAPKNSPAFTGSPVAPTPPQFDRDTSVATTEFVGRALGNLNGVETLYSNTSLAASYVGKLISLAGVNATLPAANSVPAGSALVFLGSGGSQQVIRSGADLVMGQTNLAIKQGDSVVLVSNGNDHWLAVAGAAQLSISPLFTASLAGNGYQKLPSGLIIQWGNTELLAAGASRTITLPLAFPNTPLNLSATPVVSPGTVSGQSASAQFVNNGQISVSNSGAANITSGIFWMAIGY